jgi:hypothetical protein
LQEEIAAKLFKGCWSLVADLKISGLAVIWLVSGWYLAFLKFNCYNADIIYRQMSVSG